MTVAAVVLAGGRSQRFGSDKLAADVEGVPLLQRAVSGLPPAWLLVIVGPYRRLDADRTPIFTREDPPGSGPAAALVAGVMMALANGADTVVTFPGDAPAGSAAAVELVRHLQQTQPSHPDGAVVAVDETGYEQPLQLALTGTPLRTLAARTDAAGRSARSLLADLGNYRRLPLPRRLTGDIDTPQDIGSFSGVSDLP